MGRLKCAIVGATGPAGQKLAVHLQDHPLFELVRVAASEKSAGKKFGDAITPFFQKLDCQFPKNETLEMVVQDIKLFNPREYDIVFSTLDAGIAAHYEADFAQHTPLFTSASANRYMPLVPIHNITVNDDHMKMIEPQRKKYNRKGFIVAKSNCTTSPIVSVLAKISHYGIKDVNVITEQALSGAGKKGLEEGNAYREMVKKLHKYPYIEGENEKVVMESKEILGRFNLSTLRREESSFNISAVCTRIARDNVHDELVLVKTKTAFELSEILNAILTPTHSYKLSILPANPIVLWKGKVIPELHTKNFGIMSTAIGEIKSPDENTLMFRATTDNTGIGAGPGLIASAEYAIQNGII